MNIEVKIENHNIVFMPTNTIEEYGLKAMLAKISKESEDPEVIQERFLIDSNYILQGDS